MVNIEFMWPGVETVERRALACLSIRFMPSISPRLKKIRSSDKDEYD
jgi:hypothetical protein